MAFICLGRYISRESEKSIHTVGDLYMAGINNHITAHFRTLIELKLEQAEAIVERYYTIISCASAHMESKVDSVPF